jgi:hypothetical protein
MTDPFGGFTEEALEAYQKALAEQAGTDFAEGDSYDFTTCIRPDGSAYGTRGKCRKGTEGEAKGKGAAPAAKPKRSLATSADAKAAWKESESVVKSAKAEVARVKAETKGDKSPEAVKRRLAAGIAQDKAERLAQKASDKYFAATKRESKAAMTPEQRREEREWEKNKKRLG